MFSTEVIVLNVGMDVFHDLSLEVKSAVFAPTRQTFYETVETVFVLRRRQTKGKGLSDKKCLPKCIASIG